ncbi:hypothetical protein [Methanobrevibacter curvatus]|nr:hypothetical protein [Methanobrevibacter curvatus]
MIIQIYPFTCFKHESSFVNIDSAIMHYGYVATTLILIIGLQSLV